MGMISTTAIVLIGVLVVIPQEPKLVEVQCMQVKPPVHAITPWVEAKPKKRWM